MPVVGGEAACYHPSACDTSVIVLAMAGHLIDVGPVPI